VPIGLQAFFALHPERIYHPMSAEGYRRNAAECLRLSRISTECGTKSILLNVAVSWTTLAGQAGRNLQNDVVYEPPLKKGGTGRSSFLLFLSPFCSPRSTRSYLIGRWLGGM
jgi:hypothetical protein